MVRVSLAKMWDYVQKSEPVLELNIDLIKPNPYQPRVILILSIWPNWLSLFRSLESYSRL